MPKLSSAETPPEKSSDCLPVSTIALSGVITRMPLVCISIVASAFQYGCAPTLMPATTTLISPPAWVNSMIRFSPAATQSMFSVPESIEIRAPADSANHSSGTCIRSARSMAAMIREHSGSDTAPSALVGSPHSTTRVTPSGCRAVGVVTTAARMPALLRPGRPVDRHQRAGVVEVVLDEAAVGTGEHAGELVGVDQAAAAGAHDVAVVLVERLQRLGRRRLQRRRDAGAGPGVEPDRDRGGDAVRADHPALRDHLLDAGAVGQRRDLALQRGQLVGIGLDVRPDLHPDVVGVELAAGRAARRTHPADRLEAVLHRPLGVRQAGDPALLVAYDGQLAHLRQRHQPAVGGVLPGDALVEQHVLGRVDAGDDEVAQPPQVEPAPDHRVHAADQVVLDDAAVGPSGR